MPASKWGPRLALRALLRTAQEVAQGMWHIHQCNVIHGGKKEQTAQCVRLCVCAFVCACMRVRVIHICAYQSI